MFEYNEGRLIDVDLQWLITFKTVVETGNYTKAAEKLGYTQSSITLQIKQLEQELSVRLFEKIGRKMSLTYAGQEIVPQVNQIVTLMSKLKDQHRSGGSGRLRVAVEETLLVNKLQAMIPDFVTGMPETDVRIDTTKSCMQVREALKTGELDIGMLYKAVDDKKSDPMLIETTVVKIPLVLVGANQKEVPWDNEKGIPTAAHTVYLNDENCIFHGMYKEYLASQGIEVDCVISLGSTEANLGFIEKGKGITYIPRYVVEKRLMAGTLQTLHMRDWKKDAYITYAVHKNKWITPAMELFIHLFEKSVADLAEPE